jgi:hypothetical protein
MFEAGQIKVKVDIDGYQNRRPNVIAKPITLQFVIDYIRSQGYDPFVEERLIKAVSKYPQQALTKFVGSIPSRIGKILAQRKGQEPQFRDLNDAVDPTEKTTEEIEASYSDPVGEEYDHKESFKAAIQRTEDHF